MKTTQIRRSIANAVKHEQQTHGMAQVISQGCAATGRHMQPDQVQGLVRFMQAYIQFVPDRLEEVDRAAVKAGWQEPIAPMLRAAQEYFLEPFDFIPDAYGLTGLADDAYLAHTLLQQLSERFQGETGEPLLADDLRETNQIVRALIGEPMATMLDQKVAETLDGPRFQNVISQLLALAGSGQGLNVGTSFNDYAIKQQVDLQMDLVTSSYSPSW